jgi:hypothetical protein
METTGLVYVVVILNGVTLISPEAIPTEKCDALKRYNPTMLCIDKEPDCGRASGNPDCKGQIIDPPPQGATRRARR